MKNGIGVIFQIERLLKGETESLFNMGLDCVQLNCWNPSLYTKENAEKVLEILDGKLRISSVWAGWSGCGIWNFVDGPETLGIVPEAYRYQRMQELCKGAEFTSWLGVHDMATHMGFIPEQPTTSLYTGLVNAVKWVGTCCKKYDIHFNFETGQETPITMMRTIQDTGLDNLGVNLDPANLILYGKGNPVDAIDIYGDKIRGVHVKDGNYPKDDYHKLGHETVVGEGSVNYPVFLPKLIKSGYEGDLYIEREISGPQQIIDIKKTIDYIKELID
ncbi:MAG: sugar phosphate isomerase/epimerase family protein [Bacillota bacterium]|nr:sugar phosphate isomerase/epimerase family protein [Bacillota bacterium]